MSERLKYATDEQLKGLSKNELIHIIRIREESLDNMRDKYEMVVKELNMKTIPSKNTEQEIQNYRIWISKLIDIIGSIEK